MSGYRAPVGIQKRRAERRLPYGSPRSRRARHAGRNRRWSRTAVIRGEPVAIVPAVLYPLPDVPRGIGANRTRWARAAYRCTPPARALCSRRNWRGPCPQDRRCHPVPAAQMGTLYLLAPRFHSASDGRRYGSPVTPLSQSAYALPSSHDTFITGCRPRPQPWSPACNHRSRRRTHKIPVVKCDLVFADRECPGSVT